MKQAIRPTYFNLRDEILKKKIDESIKNGSTEDEQQLALMSGTPGWKVLKEFIDNLSNTLESTNRGQIESGLSFEEIGRNAVVIQIVKDIINQITNKVQDAADAINK
jgi:hypothetical protein